MNKLTWEEMERGYDNCTECGTLGNFEHDHPTALYGGMYGFDDSDIFEDTDGTPLGRYNQIFKECDYLCGNCLHIIAKRGKNE